MSSILNIQIDVPEQVHAKIEAALQTIEEETGFPPSVNELYICALQRGVDLVAQEYPDSVIVAAQRLQQREVSLERLADLKSNSAPPSQSPRGPVNP